MLTDWQTSYTHFGFVMPLCAIVWSSEIHLLPRRGCHWFGKIFFEDIEPFYTGLIRKSGSRMPQAGRRIEASVRQFSFEVFHTVECWSPVALQTGCELQYLFYSTGSLHVSEFANWWEIIQISLCMWPSSVSISSMGQKTFQVSVGSFSNTNLVVDFQHFLFCLQYAAQMPSSRILENLYIQTDISSSFVSVKDVIWITVDFKSPSPWKSWREDRGRVPIIFPVLWSGYDPWCITVSVTTMKCSFYPFHGLWDFDIWT